MFARIFRRLTLAVSFVMLISVSLLGALPAQAAPTKQSDGPWCRGQGCWWFVRASQNSFAAVGVNATMTIEGPTVTGAVHSLASILIFTVDSNGNAVDGVELGWSVVHGKTEPLLFVDTIKGGMQTSCSDRQGCGWVQKGARYFPEKVLEKSGDSRAEKNFAILRMSDGNWWVYFDNEWFGYIEGAHWGGKFTSGQRLQWRGEVANFATTPGCTQMGNGKYGTEAGSAKIGSLGYWTHNSTGNHLTWAHPNKNPVGYDERFYNMGDHLAASWFTYGGPGACAS